MRINESDLLLYYFAVERRYFDLFELHGMLAASTKRCPHCKKTLDIHAALMRDVFDSFGGRAIRVPTKDELNTFTRDMTIWRGLSLCTRGTLGLRVEEYMGRYSLPRDVVHRIRNKVQKVVDKFQAVRNALGHKTHS